MNKTMIAIATIILLFDFSYGFSIYVHALNKNYVNSYDDFQKIINFQFTLIGILIICVIILCYILSKKNKIIKEKNNEIHYLKESHKTFINSINTLVYLKDENHNYLFVNKAFENLYGKDLSCIIGKDDSFLDDEELANKRLTTDIEAIEKNAVVNDELFFHNKYYHKIKFPVKMLNGKTGVGAFIFDTTELHKNRRKIEKTLQRNSILVNVLNKKFATTKEQLDYVLNETLKLTGSKLGYIYLYDERTMKFKLNSWSKSVMKECQIEDKQKVYNLDKTGFWGEAVRQRKAVINNDFEEANEFKKGYPEGHVKIKKFMSVPVIVDGKIVAVIGLANKEEEYDNNDIFQITALMKGVWNAKERREALVELSIERKKYLITLLSIGDGVLVVDKQGNIEMLNKVAEELTGWKNAQAIGKHYKEVFILVHEYEGLTINDPIEGVFTTDSIHELDNHAILISKDGSRHHLEDSASPIKDESGKTIGVVLIFRNVTEKKEQRKKIEYMSFHDDLTGLYNRRFYDESLKKIDIQENLPISVIMGDVNDLKLTNDVFGHRAGDALLIKAAEIIKKVSREGDIAARIGGDEFIMILPKTSAKDAGQINMRIKELFSREKLKAINVSISTGCDTKETSIQDILQVISNADEKMYTEKTITRENIKKTIITTLIHTLHKNSPRERAHSKIVSEICYKIGKAMNMNEIEIKKLKYAGFLHDIGKVVMDENLLNKNDALTEEEWLEMKRHPIVGYRILNSFDSTIDLADYVLGHHERWDGNGYPKGLKENEINKGARIISVAESYDKMTNPLNKTALSNEEVIHEFKIHSGLQFDPGIVEIFIEMLKNN